MSFEVRVPGKWVLAGEHSVLRGGPALALPRKDIELVLNWDGGDGEPLDPELVRDAASLLKTAVPDGEPRVSSTIPRSAGLGSSAALCVGLVRAIGGLNGLELSDEKEIEAATRLEDRFHGRSSGMDVAAVACARPIVYRRGEPVRVLDVPALPRFTFHDTGLRGNTRECVEAVQALEKRNPGAVRELDAEMARAVPEAEAGLSAFAEKDGSGRMRGTEQVASAMNRAQRCFEGWGLIPPEVQRLADELKDSGALGVKLTGSGRGGFLVAVWAPAEWAETT